MVFSISKEKLFKEKIISYLIVVGNIFLISVFFYLLYFDKIDSSNIFGIGLVIGIVVFYSYLKFQEFSVSKYVFLKINSNKLTINTNSMIVPISYEDINCVHIEYKNDQIKSFSLKYKEDEICHFSDFGNLELLNLELQKYLDKKIWEEKYL